MRKLIFILLAQADTEYTLISSAPRREVAVCKMWLPKGCKKGGGRESVKHRLSLVHLSIRSLQGLRTPSQTDPRCWTSFNALRGERRIHSADKAHPSSRQEGGEAGSKGAHLGHPKGGSVAVPEQPAGPSSSDRALCLGQLIRRQPPLFLQSGNIPVPHQTAILCFQSSRNSLGIFL